MPVLPNNEALTKHELTQAKRYLVQVMSDDTVFIDCFGRSYQQDIKVQVDGRPWHFIYDQSKKKGVRFTAAVFLDRAILHERTLYRYPSDRRFFVLWESPNEPHFSHLLKVESQARAIFTHDEDLLARSPDYQRLDYSVSWINDGIPMAAPEKNRLISFMGSIQHPTAFGYELRKAVASRFASNTQVDCYGKGIREVESKLTALAPYCFSIAMENTQKNFYYTEKLIDCFIAKTIPVYWGCDRIGEIFDERGMIRFQTLEELESIVAGLSFDKYRSMLPYAEANAARVVNGRMGTYAELYTKLAENLSPIVRERSPVAAFQRSKAAAMFRYGKMRLMKCLGVR
jgi:hypothetical protein